MDGSIATGTMFKNWQIGSYIAQGAFGAVYNATPLRPVKGFNEFVIKLSPLPMKSQSKKMQKEIKRKADMIYFEYMQYNNLQHPNIARIPPNAYGEANGYRFLVMEKLQDTLFARYEANGPFAERIAASLFITILDVFEYLHKNNKLYVDVNPDNFIFGPNNQLYCTDFGLASSYVGIRGHVDCVQGNVCGTPTYLSLDAHNGFTHARKDDIEGLLYMMIHMMKGDLPWHAAQSDVECVQIKESTDLSDLCSWLSQVWLQCLVLIRECEFADKPDYATLRDLAKQLL
jgi:serine/threonine protein kinase